MTIAASVEAVMAQVDRRGFLPPGQRRDAGRDHPLPIGHGQTSSQPYTVATMLTLLDVHPDMQVLDVGSGSGWTTALLGRLVGPRGRVRGVELVPDLVEFGATNLASQAMAWTSIEQAVPGVLGKAIAAPYDRILVSAEARTVPDQLVSQLGPDGVLVLPVAGTMTRVRRTPSGDIRTEHGYFRFVPLR